MTPKQQSMFENHIVNQEHNDSLSKHTMRRTMETFIAHTTCSKDVKETLIQSALDMVALSGKNRDGECTQSSTTDRIASLAVYEACVRNGVDPPFQYAQFASRMHGLLRSKAIQKFRDEMQVKSPLGDATILRRHILTKGKRCIRFVERAFRSYVKTNTLPRALFYAAAAIWSLLSTRIAHDASIDARNLPSVVFLACTLIHDCVACSPWSHYVSQNSSYVLDQILNIVAGSKIGCEAIGKHRRYMMLHDSMPLCYAMAKKLCLCKPSEAWGDRARAFQQFALSEIEDDEASKKDALDALEEACGGYEATETEVSPCAEMRAVPFHAEPIENILVKPFI